MRFDPELLVPLAFFMIPIVAILTGHQRKMAEILSRRQQPVETGETAALRQEVAELKDMLRQQMILQDSRPPTPPIPSVEERLRA